VSAALVAMFSLAPAVAVAGPQEIAQASVRAACAAVGVPCAPVARAAGPDGGPPQQPHTMNPAPASDEREYPSLKITGFGDIDFSSTHPPEGPRGFSEGQFVLHLASELSPRVTFFGEISFTPRADAGTGSPPASGFNTEVERMILRFDRSDQLKVSFGRYHTPINWWNTAFHHGQWLQTTITRPEMIEFGGRFLPVHFVGALVEGAVPASGWNVNYQAGLGNGRGAVISRAGDAGDNNGKRAWLVSVFSKPDRAFGLQFGGSLYEDTVTLASNREVGERIVSAHVAWTKEDPEFIAEVAGVRHADAASSSAVWSHAFYVQSAYRLPWFGRLWKPYYRFEHIGVNPTDAVFQTVPNLDGSTLGVRYDLTLFAAIKAEYRTWRRGAGLPRNYGGFLQICFTF
jgi:hypothetical protein